MKKNAFPLLLLLSLAACGHGDQDKDSKSKPMALDPNPPFGASDIDSTVAETKRRMAPAHPRPHPVVKPTSDDAASMPADNGTNPKN